MGEAEYRDLIRELDKAFPRLSDKLVVIDRETEEAFTRVYIRLDKLEEYLPHYLANTNLKERIQALETWRNWLMGMLVTGTFANIFFMLRG